jgi:DNA-3-methyladenine glycosylase II
MRRFFLHPKGPYDFALSRRAAASFSPDAAPESDEFRMPVRIGNTLLLLTLRQKSMNPPIIEGRITAKGNVGEAKAIAGRVISAETDLKPFYRAVRTHPVLGPITRRLQGLKPLRPASLFDMFVIAITEQQISLTAAYHIRSRLVERMGESVAGLRAFPSATALAKTPLATLTACGLSHRKAEYIRGLARKVATRELDLNSLEAMPDVDAYKLLIEQRGIGPWAAEYILVRGMGRVDRVPAVDLGVRTVAANYLARGRRLSPLGVKRKLGPFSPYRGLAVFYLLADARLHRLARPKR